jgi:hypothetical protein
VSSLSKNEIITKLYLNQGISTIAFLLITIAVSCIFKGTAAEKGAISIGISTAGAILFETIVIGLEIPLGLIVSFLTAIDAVVVVTAIIAGYGFAPFFKTLGIEGYPLAMVSGATALTLLITFFVLNGKRRFSKNEIIFSLVSTLITIGINSLIFIWIPRIM